jgi:hypothetical protein
MLVAVTRPGDRERDGKPVPSPKRVFPEPRFDGYDLVSASVSGADGKARRLVRGRDDIFVPDQGPRYLFSSWENAKAFADQPTRYLPAFDGAAVDWIRIGERMPGNPSYSCVSGGRLVFFASRSASTAGCPPTLVELDSQWAELARAAPQFREPVSGGGDGVINSPGIRRTYQITPDTKIVAPRGGSVIDGYFPSIKHGDGSISRLLLSGGRFRPFPRDTLVRQGDPLNFTVSDGEKATLDWFVSNLQASEKAPNSGPGQPSPAPAEPLKDAPISP